MVSSEKGCLYGRRITLTLSAVLPGCTNTTPLQMEKAFFVPEGLNLVVKLKASIDCGPNDC